jgi:hypothetical protein
MRHYRRMTINRWLDLFSPFIVRILARDRSCNKGGAITRAGILAACGKSESWLSGIERLDDWDSVPYGDVALFIRATGIHSNRAWRKDRSYLMRAFTASRTAPLHYIDTLPPEERKAILRLIAQKADSIKAALEAMRHA